jgi:hypothetical protein
MDHIGRKHRTGRISAIGGLTSWSGSYGTAGGYQRLHLLKAKLGERAPRWCCPDREVLAPKTNSLKQRNCRADAWQRATVCCCPRQGRLDGPICRIEVFEPWVAALDGLAQYEKIEVLYWLDRSRRDLVRQSPKSDSTMRGTFSLRSPARPNPIGTSLVALVEIKANEVLVRGLDLP